MSILRMVCEDMENAQRSLQQMLRMRGALNEPLRDRWNQVVLNLQHEMRRCGHMLAAGCHAENDE